MLRTIILLCCIFLYQNSRVEANSLPCDIQPWINGQKVPVNCTRRLTPVENAAAPVVSSSLPMTYRDAYGQAIGVPTGSMVSPQMSQYIAPPTNYPQMPQGGVCISDTQVTEQLVEIINNVLVNIKIVDDGVPIYLHDGQLVMNPNYANLMKKRKDAAKRENYFCPHDYEGRICDISYRFSNEAKECTEDSQCKVGDGYLRLCCKDYCLNKNVCKPALAKIL